MTKYVRAAQLYTVFDVELLLPKVVWQRGAKISKIFEIYITFIIKNYHGERCDVLFDGYYLSTSSTKLADQQRHYRLWKST